MNSFWNEIEYFKPHEFDSPDAPGSGVNMDEGFVRLLDQLRGMMGKPLKVSSGYRTWDYHVSLYKRLGKEPPKNSEHLAGRAADIVIAGEDADRLLYFSYILGFTGRGISQKGAWGSRFIHLDTRPDKPSIWSY